LLTIQNIFDITFKYNEIGDLKKTFNRRSLLLKIRREEKNLPCVKKTIIFLFPLLSKKNGQASRPFAAELSSICFIMFSTSPKFCIMIRKIKLWCLGTNEDL
jgi:hypothetical protein